jgi:hypothetical protein
MRHYSPAGSAIGLHAPLCLDCLLCLVKSTEAAHRLLCRFATPFMDAYLEGLIGNKLHGRTRITVATTGMSSQTTFLKTGGGLPLIQVCRPGIS